MKVSPVGHRPLPTNLYQISKTAILAIIIYFFCHKIEH